MKSLKPISACAIAALAGLPMAANAQIKAIFSNTAPATNVVPTIGGAFAIGTSSSIAFDHAFLSPDGTRWILGAIQEAGTDDKDIIIIGGGTTSAGASTVAVEDTATSFDPLRNYDILDPQMGITNAGLYCFTADLNGATTDDEVLVVFNGTTLVAAAREGSASPIGGQNFGATIDGAHIIADGSPRYRAALSPLTTKFILASGATVLSETDVSTPTGQLVAPDQTMDLFTTNRFTSNADGTRTLWHGDLNGATTTDDVMVLDNAVLGQQGAPLPGGVFGSVNVSTFFTDINSQVISPNGNHWMFRAVMADGTGATATDIVLKNGAIAAKTGDPIYPGSTELWDDTVFTVTYFQNTVNNNGDMVIGGLTNNPDVNLDAVLVYYPASGTPVVLAREGDPIDLNGDGLMNDDAFVDIFGNDDGVISADGNYYFIVAVQNGANTSVGNAFVFMPIPTPPAACYANCDGSSGNPLLTANDFQCFINKFAGDDPYANCDQSTGTPALTANDFQCFVNKFAGGCS